MLVLNIVAYLLAIVFAMGSVMLFTNFLRIRPRELIASVLALAFIGGILLIINDASRATHYAIDWGYASILSLIGVCGVFIDKNESRIREKEQVQTQTQQSLA